MPRNQLLSPELRETYTEELEALLDEFDDISAKRKRINKALRGELNMIVDSIYQLRLRLKGLGGDQQEIPGTETGQRKRDPSVAAILKAAGHVRDEEEQRARRAKGESDA